MGLKPPNSIIRWPFASFHRSLHQPINQSLTMGLCQAAISINIVLKIQRVRIWNQTSTISGYLWRLWYPPSSFGLVWKQNWKLVWCLAQPESRWNRTWLFSTLKHQVVVLLIFGGWYPLPLPLFKDPQSRCRAVSSRLLPDLLRHKRWWQGLPWYKATKSWPMVGENRLNGWYIHQVNYGSWYCNKNILDSIC